MSTPSVVLRRALLGGAALTVALALPACGADSSGSGTSHGSGTAATVSARAGATADDVMFAQLMIAHHRQAVAMAALAGTRAASSEVKALARTIEQAQQPEIDIMNGWLSGWGSPAPAPSGSLGSGHTAHGSMPGAMSGADLAELARAEGAAFDRRFLTMMIAHHQGAVTMARQESAQGGDPAARALAAKIVTDQQAEIDRMRDLLTKL